MRFRFIGKYTNGNTGINACGVDFTGREAVEVTDPDGVRRLTGNPEFERIHPLDHDGDGVKGGKPRKRGKK